ncbi:MerR family transcriptional regulator [Streptomyces sedi]|uniref:MerR family transcriptional regulator n=1 Tax=Streptomyces sedi TaxID=555059 RepID=A0A5C4V1K7_9ACTN|nr:MerR family transcriptional regulator [Streptomyces sedi]TNM29870.1 MerR family transcriptional regulator [Streptomyces sedi]
MGRNPQTVGQLRPVDLARRHGLSTQAVRNYEDAGALPAAARTAAGYRVYTARHGDALRAFLALVPGHGHQAATAIMRAVHGGVDDEAFQLIDASHVRLREDRRTLQAVERALADLGPAPAESAGRPRFVGPLARELGVRAATLRAWERAGLLRPSRDAATGYRVYAKADVRDARMVRQLRRGGYPLGQIAPLIEQVRAAGGPRPLEAALGDWRGRLAARGRALLAGAAALEAYLVAWG